MPRRPASLLVGGQGVRSDPESPKGLRRSIRAVIDLGETPDEQVGQRWGKVEPAVWGRRRYSHSPIVPRCLLTARLRKIHAWTPGDLPGVLVDDWVSDPISESEVEAMRRQESENVIVPEARDE